MHELVIVSRLFGHLLLQEVDADLLHTLQQPDIMSGLAELGIDVPGAGDEAAILEELAVEYCSCFVVAPNQVPLVQSIWEHGSYEGPSVNALRELADAAEFDFDREAAHDVPIDHLGCILLFWSELVEADWPDAYNHVAKNHLAWARVPLQKLAAREGFYAQLAESCLYLIEELQSTAMA